VDRDGAGKSIGSFDSSSDSVVESGYDSSHVLGEAQ